MKTLFANCPRCQEAVELPATMAGHSTTCMKCGQAFNMPNPGKNSRWFLWVLALVLTLAGILMYLKTMNLYRIESR